MRSQLTETSDNCGMHEQQIEVLQETIRNLQSKWLQMKIPECLKSLHSVGEFEKHLKEQTVVNDALLVAKTSPRKPRSLNFFSQLDTVVDSLETAGGSGGESVDSGGGKHPPPPRYRDNSQVIPIIDIDIDKSDDDDDEEVKIVEDDQTTIKEKKENQTSSEGSTINLFKLNNSKNNTTNKILDCDNSVTVKDNLLPPLMVEDDPSNDKVNYLHFYYIYFY